MARKVLVAYATKMGATADIAAAIGTELAKLGHDADSRAWDLIGRWARDIGATMRPAETSDWTR
jgi:menaquinone-dependent protoporphyrinogen IX oxidase